MPWWDASTGLLNRPECDAERDGVHLLGDKYRLSIERIVLLLFHAKNRHFEKGNDKPNNFWHPVAYSK